MMRKLREVKKVDVNGVKLEVGQIVKISNAYFKCDNGYYFIEHEPDAPNWCGTDYSLQKINSRTGQLSTAKYSTAFWPLISFTSDKTKGYAADEWNAENAIIEVVYNITNEYVIAHFEEHLERIKAQEKRDAWNFGEEAECVIKANKSIEYISGVIARLHNQNTEPAKAEKETEPAKEKTIYLQGIGTRPATETQNIKINDVIMFNYGYEYIVKAVEKETNNFIYFVIVSEDGKEYVKQMKKNSLWYISRHIEEITETEANNANDDFLNILQELECKLFYACEGETNSAKDEAHKAVKKALETYCNATQHEQPQEAEQTAQTSKEEQPQEKSQTKLYYTINESTARTAQQLNSFSDYKEGTATNTYKLYCDEVYKIAEEVAEKQPKNAEKAAAMAQRYAKKLGEYYNDYYRNEAYCPSVMVCGPANFPTQKKEKQNARRETLNNTWNYLESYKNRIKGLLQPGAIKSGDADAIEEIQAKIDKLTAEKETAKQFNLFVRQGGKPAEFVGLSKDFKRSLLFQLEYMHTEKPQLDTTNTNAEIRRLQSRLEQLKKAKETGNSEEENELFTIVRNAEIMRLQLVFDGIPESSTRETLKKHGFKWSPKNKAWQRILNNNSEYALKQVKKELNIA